MSRTDNRESGRVHLDVQIASRAGGLPDPEELQRWADAAWRGEGEVEATIRIVDEAESAELNSTYRHKEGPTNVLSFPMEPAPVLDVPLLGDLVICAPVVRREAAEQSKTAAAHWAHMVVHGLLHLQGHDHVLPEEAETMEALETDIMRRLGYANPYRPITEET